MFNIYNFKMCNFTENRFNFRNINNKELLQRIELLKSKYKSNYLQIFYVNMIYISFCLWMFARPYFIMLSRKVPYHYGMGFIAFDMFLTY